MTRTKPAALHPRPTKLLATKYNSTPCSPREIRWHRRDKNRSTGFPKPKLRSCRYPSRRETSREKHYRVWNERRDLEIIQKKKAEAAVKNLKMKDDRPEEVCLRYVNYAVEYEEYHDWSYFRDKQAK